MVDDGAHDPKAEPGAHDGLLVGCDDCAARGPACDDCVVSVLLGPPRERLELDAAELSALDALATAGLVPPLRLVRQTDPPEVPDRATMPDG